MTGAELRLGSRRPGRRPVRSERRERERSLVATPAAGRRDQTMAFDGPLGDRVGRWRHRSTAKVARCRSVIARSSRRCGRVGALRREASASRCGSEPGPVYDGYAADVLALARRSGACRRVNLVATRRRRGGGEAFGHASRARISAPRVTPSQPWSHWTVATSACTAPLGARCAGPGQDRRHRAWLRLFEDGAAARGRPA